MSKWSRICSVSLKSVGMAQVTAKHLCPSQLPFRAGLPYPRSVGGSPEPPLIAKVGLKNILRACDRRRQLWDTWHNLGYLCRCSLTHSLAERIKLNWDEKKKSKLGQKEYREKLKRRLIWD